MCRINYVTHDNKIILLLLLCGKFLKKAFIQKNVLFVRNRRYKILSPFLSSDSQNA